MPFDSLEVPSIEFTRLHFRLQAASAISLPPFPGSVFRGGFGAALRKACCTLEENNCADCMLKTSCVYSAVFETSEHNVKNTGYKLSDYPRPFIIEPWFPVQNIVNPGDLFSCRVVVIGDALKYLPYFVLAFANLGRTGLGKSRGLFVVKKATCSFDPFRKTVFDGDSEQFVNSPETLTFDSFFRNRRNKEEMELFFETPIRIKNESAIAKDLDFELLMKNLFRRITLLIDVCRGKPLELDFNALLSKAKSVETVTSDLYWYSWSRYSAKQKQAMEMGGMLGSIVFRGDLTPFEPFISLGQHLHVGKACTFGLGKYHLKSL